MAELGRVRIIGGPLDGENVALSDVLQDDGGLPDVVELAGATYHWFARVGGEPPEVVLAPRAGPPHFRPLRLFGPMRPPGDWKGWG